MAWFDDIVREIVWKAIRDSANAIGAWTEQQAEAFLAGLTPGRELSKNPAITVVGADDQWVALLVRGRQPIGPLAPLLRMEVRVSKNVNITSEGPLSDVELDDVVGDLVVEKENLFRGAIALGYLDGAWLGRGGLKILPAGFGLDIALGGLDERGFMIGLDLDLPAAVPLGTSGLGLKGIGGDFAYNFVPRLEDPPGVPVAAPTAAHYVSWAKNSDIDRWRPGPLDETAVGVAIRADLVTSLDNGFTLTLEPVGMALLGPGPVFIVGGAGKLLKQNSVKAEGYLAIDIASASIALGLDVSVRVPAVGQPMLVEAKGALNAFFSFDDPSAWYLRLGTQASPVSVRVLRHPAFWTATGYLALDNDQVLFGVGLAVDRSWTVSVVKLTAKAAINADALVGWDPIQLRLGVKLAGELGLKVWKIGCALKLYAQAIADIPDPTRLKFEVGYTIDLPWPIPDISGKADLVLGDDPQAPELHSPLLAGAGATQRVAALQTITGRQWELHDGASALPEVWPDIELVVPFARPVTDATGAVVGDPVPSEDAGGYTVTNRLETLELRDLVHDTVVPDVKAVWAAAPGGTTARLHVLARDPYSWLLPHDSTHGFAGTTPPYWYEQRFGFGPEMSFTNARRFGQVLVDPTGTAKLLDDFAPAIATRVLRGDRFQLAFRQPDDAVIEVDRVALLILSERDVFEKVVINGATETIVTHLGEVVGDVHLFELSFTFPDGRSTFDVQAGHDALLVVAVRYRVAAGLIVATGTTTVLEPGRYRLTLTGRTEATKPDPDYPDAAPVDWGLTHDFEVVHPDTTRPYTLAAAPGDARAFGAERDSWHPTAAGAGFPGYRDYAVTVRTRVNYLDKIFDRLEVKVTTDGGLSTTELLVPTPNPANESTALAETSGWVAAGGGSIGPDDELAGTVALPDDPGAADVEVTVIRPDGGRHTLDRWPCVISGFRRFRDHLAWDGTCIETTYGAAGPAAVTACPVPNMPYRRRTPWERVTRVHHRGRVLTQLTDVFVDFGDLVVDDGDPYPDELGHVPGGWALPAELAELVTPESPTWSRRALLFALRSGARFSLSPLRLDGFTAPVPATTVEAIVDSSGRPYALLLRTPEPLDWRRVSATMRVQHTAHDGGASCPTGYTKRRPLALDVQLLPTPDASAALLVGVFAGVATRLPRGVIDLTLTFDPAAPGLARLRPLPSVGATPEVVTLRFVQPSGATWPQPDDGVVFPAGFLEWLRAQHAIDLEYELARWRRTRRPIPIPRPEPDPFRALGARALEETDR